ncbi:MAG: ABC transporter permease subunit [Rhodospirillales bacterium]|nr:ABC transporter permease subunit [Rhodospirillales bacterium]
MSVRSAGLEEGKPVPSPAVPIAVGVALLVVVLAIFNPAWSDRWPESWEIPLAAWTTSAFQWLANDLSFGLFTFRNLTRGIAWLLDRPFDLVEGVLFRGFRGLGLGPIPWLALSLALGIAGYRLGGTRLAMLAALGVAYLAIFGVWKDSMRTLSLVAVTVPLAALVGIGLGVLATRKARAEKILQFLFDIMQATPHLAYLGPVAAFFGFGSVPGMIATAIFAMPPMARCTILGIRTVPDSVLEAGVMAGCSPRQLLWRVQLPAAKRTLLVGVNQVIMQTLAMAVIASLIGASGLGHKLLFSLQQLQLGKAIESGVAIVIMAIVLDRLSQAWAKFTPNHLEEEKVWWQRHRALLSVIGTVIVVSLLSMALPFLAKLPKSLTITTAPFWDGGIRWMSKNLFDYLEFLRDDFTLHVLIPLRNFFLWLPWPALAGFVGILAWRIGGTKPMLISLGLLLFILVTGFWVPAMMTLYLTSLAAVICMGLGVPIGIWSARSPSASKVILTICDTLQTFPSFIYLIPVIMLFRVGDLASLVAIIGYAMVPAIRYTNLGLSRVPPSVVEAARASGTAKRQMLFKVKLPMAMPEIMLGLNQTIVLALSMTAITALIGSRDLGQQILKALPDLDTGRGLLAGLCIAAIGLIASQMIESWVKQRKKQLGLSG